MSNSDIEIVSGIVPTPFGTKRVDRTAMTRNSGISRKSSCQKAVALTSPRKMPRLVSRHFLPVSPPTEEVEVEHHYIVSNNGGVWQFSALGSTYAHFDSEESAIEAAIAAAREAGECWLAFGDNVASNLATAH